MTPVLPTRFEWLASATDKAREQADRRLAQVLGHLDELGSEPAGTLGADDPLLAFADAVGAFDPDHILISLRAGARSGWQEEDLLDKVHAEFGLPMTVFSLPGE